MDASVIAESASRVAEVTRQAINERIAAQTKQRIAEVASEGVGAIERRLDELDHEWDIERVLAANAASFSLAGVALSAAVDRRFLALPALVGGFLLQHAIQGWCPPIALFRRLGYRTRQEIDYERYALKSLRGDFHRMPTSTDVRKSGTAVVDQTMEAVQS
jgi:hypothetical protein